MQKKKNHCRDNESILDFWTPWTQELKNKHFLIEAVFGPELKI